MSYKRQAFVYDPFCLGMCDWTDCPGAHLKETESPSRPVINLDLTLPPSLTAPPPPAPTATLSAQGKSSLPSPKRFNFSDENELEEMAKGNHSS